MFTEKKERILVLILLVLSLCTHFFFFGKPASVVFDEVYYASFASDYSTGAYYFDVHPPLGKLIYKYFGDVIGTTYDADFRAIGNPVPWGVVALRLLPVLAGVLLPLLIYFICRRLKFSSIVSFAGALLIILENSLLVESRFILFEPFLLFFGFSSVLLYLVYTSHESRKSLLWCSALCATFAFSVKWTGLAFPLLLLVAEIVRTKQVKVVAKFFSVYALVGLVVYLGVFALHFSYLTHSGQGDNFMTDRFQSTLIGNRYFGNPDLKPKGLFGKTLELNMEMLQANRTLNAIHAYSSHWYSWPFMVRPVFYWQGTSDSIGNSYIYLLGNPLIYWLGTLSVLWLMWYTLRRKLEDASFFILVGFLVNFVPFMFIGRVMFIYIYEPALVFSILAICYLLEKKIPEKKKMVVIGTLLVICFAIFIYLSPLTYGLHMTDAELMSRMWLPTWR